MITLVNYAPIILPTAISKAFPRTLINLESNAKNKVDGQH